MVYGIPLTQSFYTIEEKRLTQLSDWIYEDFQFLEFFFYLEVFTIFGILALH